MVGRGQCRGVGTRETLTEELKHEESRDKDSFDI